MRITRPLHLLPTAALLAITFGCVPPRLHVVFVAGPKDHCIDNPCHEYARDLRFLRQALPDRVGRRRILSRFYLGERAPADVLATADVLVVHSSADRKEGEWHALAPTIPPDEPYPAADAAYLLAVDAAMQRGTGLVSLHYTNWVDHPELRRYYGRWLGGYFRRDTSRVKADFRIPGTVAEVGALPAGNGDHPVLRGIDGWTAASEWYYRMYFPEPDRIVPLLTVGLPVDDPREEIVAWAYERPGGGRAVGFTEGHFHSHMQIEDYRRFLINAILWSGGVRPSHLRAAAPP